MTNLQRIRRLTEAAKKLPKDRAKELMLAGLEVGRRMRMHVNAKAKKVPDQSGKPSP